MKPTLTVPVWCVTLDTPQGQYVVEVPTFQGQQAAERRAHIALVAAGTGDLDEVKVIHSEQAT